MENRLCMESNHGTQDLEIDTLTIIHVLCWLNFINIGGELGTVPHVLNLLWTWNYCCKLEIVCADGSTFVVTKGFDALREDH